MIITKIHKLLRSKYVGSRVIVSRDKNCPDNKLSIFVQVPEEFVNESDTIQKEIRANTKVTFSKINPPTEQ